MPIQILPAAPQRQSYGSQLGEALGGGLGQGVSQGVQQHFKNKIEKESAKAKEEAETKRLIQEYSLKESLLSKEYGLKREAEQLKRDYQKGLVSEIEGKNNPEQLNNSSSKLQENPQIPQVVSTLEEMLGFKLNDDQKQSVTTQLQGFGSEGQNQNNFGNNQPQIQAKDQNIQENKLENTENSHLESKQNTLLKQARQYEAAGMHNLAAVKLKEYEAENKKTIAQQKETLPLRKEFADKSKYARQGIDSKKGLLKLLEKGEVDSPIATYVASLLPAAVGNKLLSADTQLYKAGLFEEFGVLKQMFPGQIRVKEIELLEDKLATLDKSHEAKAKILDNGILKLERDIILADSARKVEKLYPNASILEFEELVSQHAQPEMDKLFDKIVKGYEKVYIDFAPSKSSYVDQHGQKYSNVPKSDLKRLFDEAKEQGVDLRPVK